MNIGSRKSIYSDYITTDYNTSWLYVIKLLFFNLIEIL